MQAVISVAGHSFPARLRVSPHITSITGDHSSRFSPCWQMVVCLSSRHPHLCTCVAGRGGRAHVLYLQRYGRETPTRDICTYRRSSRPAIPFLTTSSSSSTSSEPTTSSRSRSNRFFLLDRISHVAEAMRDCLCSQEGPSIQVLLS
jgi:hypothetical protein